MKFLVVTHATHSRKGDKYYTYGPYAREMNLWFRHVDEVKFVAHVQDAEPDKIDLALEHPYISFYRIPAFSLKGIKNKLKTALSLPYILIQTIRGMMWADHIHLRSPGNMGLVGLVAQVFFPKKIKTVKYAGNWDDYPGEHRSYKMQKQLSRNTAWAKNTSVLIYGEWPNPTKNMLPFFTASYTEKDVAAPVAPRELKEPVRLLFVGTLDERKMPLYTLQVLHKMLQAGTNATLDIVGKGPDEELVKNYILEHKLEDKVNLHGNISPEATKQFYSNAHFLVFLSRMEGWPKVIAEAMFWGCVPITTPISCVPFMLGNGERGALVERDADSAFKAVMHYLHHPQEYKEAAEKGISWSRQYTLERFESEIKKLIRK